MSILNHCMEEVQDETKRHISSLKKSDSVTKITRSSLDGSEFRL